MPVDGVVVGRIDTSLGPFGAVLSPRGLCCLTYPTEPLARCQEWARRRLPGLPVADHHARLDELAGQLNAYLAGALRRFSVPLDLLGTPFQRQVWQALLEIPYGQTRTYAGVAAAIGRPAAVRAVGAANGANPVPIVVPCHRLLGSQGELVGYGGGLELKRWLLHLEGAPSAGSA